MDNQTDQQLLRDYTGRRSEAAFAELVRRHVDLVYSAALRMVRDPHLAEDVTQAVFVALVQNARQLADRPVLSGWLHRTAQNLAANAVRSTVRRRAREQEAAAMNELLAHESDAVWEHIAPHLDAALGELAEPDRDALLLRYFERKSAREMALTLGVSEDAAQKRVTRAVERLREFFAKRGVTIGAGGLVVLISANAVQAAPTGLVATISAAAALVGATIQTSTAVVATKAIAMTTLQKSLITTALAAAVSAGIYQAHQASTLRTQVQTLQQQQAPLAGQIEQLRQERGDLTNRLALLVGENAALKGNSAELLRLRSEVGALRSQNQVLTRSNADRPGNGKTPALNKGFGTLGEYLPAESLSDAGNGSAESLLKTSLWAVREGKMDRLEQIGAPIGGQTGTGDTVGELSESEAATFKMFQGALTNSAGFHLSSRESGDGRQYEVRVETEPLAERKSDSYINNFNVTLVLEQKSNGWAFGDKFADSGPK